MYHKEFLRIAATPMSLTSSVVKIFLLLNTDYPEMMIGLVKYCATVGFGGGNAYFSYKVGAGKRRCWMEWQKVLGWEGLVWLHTMFFFGALLVDGYWGG